MHTLYLVSCVSEKATSPAAAKDLYQSDWFKKARTYVESTGSPWKILSALHHVVSPDTVIGPYDSALTYPGDPNNRCRRQTWSAITAGILARSTFKGTRVVIFAGHAYREFLEPALCEAGFTVEAPLSRLGIGQQKRWFLNHAAPSTTSAGNCLIQLPLFGTLESEAPACRDSAS